MNTHAHIEEADAFFQLSDRKSLLDPKAAHAIRQVLHKSQIDLFQLWRRDLSEFPILVSAQILSAPVSKGGVFTSTPMALCRDMGVVRRYFRAVQNRVPPFDKIEHSVSIVLLSNEDEAAEAYEIMASIAGGRAL